jgi:DNA-binding response OmpR family regulator
LLPETQITVAILSGNPLVGRVLELLLGSAGYEVRLLEEPEAFEVADLLAGVDVLLLDRGVSDERRVDFLGAMASKLETASIPVLALSPGPEGALAAEDRLVPWPSRVEDLAREIDAVLLATRGREPAEEASAG